MGAVACERQPAPASTSVAVGAPIPALHVQDLDGQASTLEAFAGRLVVLNLWATWCAPCRRELPSLDRLARLLDNKNFAVVGIAVDEDAHRVREYLRDVGVGFPNYLDPRGQSAAAALGITVYPATLVIAPDGRILAAINGERVWHTLEMVDNLQRARRGENAVF